MPRTCTTKQVEMQRMFLMCSWGCYTHFEFQEGFPAGTCRRGDICCVSSLSNRKTSPGETLGPLLLVSHFFSIFCFSWGFLIFLELSFQDVFNKVYLYFLIAFSFFPSTLRKAGSARAFWKNNFSSIPRCPVRSYTSLISVSVPHMIYGIN